MCEVEKLKYGDQLIWPEGETAYFRGKCEYAECVVLIDADGNESTPGADSYEIEPLAWIGSDYSRTTVSRSYIEAARVCGHE